MHQPITIDSSVHCKRTLAAALTVLAAIALALFLGIGTAWAAPEDPTSSSSAAGEGASESSSTESTEADSGQLDAIEALTIGDSQVGESGLTIGNDAFISAQELESKGIIVAANLFASGQNLSIEEGVVGADAFISGETIDLDKLVAGNNLFVAGNNITLRDASANTLFIAGNNLDIDGDMDTVNAAGKTVFLKGTFTGDVNVGAANVIVDPYIVVEGSLNVSADVEPTIASTAKVGSFNFNQSDSEGSFSLFSTPDVGSTAWLWNLLFMFLGMLLLGVLVLLFLRTEVVDGAGKLIKERPLALFVSGFLTIILLPVLVALLFLTGVGWTVATALIFAIVAITMFAGTFTAISLGRAIMGRINKWVSSIIMIAIFAALFCLPIVDFVLGALCTLYFSGSIIQGWWVWRRRKDLDAGTKEPDYTEFTVPRGTHVNPPVTENAVAPVPSVKSIPSTNSADYRPSNLGE